jgi:four helix bundle protein
MTNKEIDLKVRTKAFALRIIKLFTSLPKTTEAQVMGKQVLRSGTSIGAQYREACVRVQALNSSVRWKVVCKN